MKAAASSCVLLHPSALRPHPLEGERRARAPVNAGRAEAVLVILPVEQVLDLAEEAKAARLGERQRVAGGQVGAALAPEAVGARAESPVVEDRREVVARRDEAEVDGDAPTEALGGDERELVVWYRERAQDVFDLRAALVAVRAGVGGEQVDRARGCEVAGKL